MQTRSLATDGEEAAARRVHEDEFGAVASIGSISVDTENELTGTIIDGEAISGEEKTCFTNSELCFFLVNEASINYDPAFRHVFFVSVGVG